MNDREVEAVAANAIRRSLWSTWGKGRQTTDWPSDGDLRMAAIAALDAVQSPQAEDHEAIERIVAAASDLQYPDAFVGRVVRQNLAALASAPSPERDTERLRESLQEWKDAWTAQGKIHAAETARLERDTERFMKALRELKAVLAEFPDTDTENG